MNNIFHPENDMTINEAVDAYLDDKNGIGSLSQASVKNRGYELRRFAKFCKENKVVYPYKIHKNMVTAYIKSLKISNSSKLGIIYILTGFMDYLVDQGVLLENIASLIARPKIYPPSVDYLSYHELERIYQAVAQKSGKKAIDRNLLLISLFTDICLRVSEAIQLKLNDVRLDTKELWITRKHHKVDKIPLNEDLVNKFLRWYDARSGYKGSETDWVFLSSHGTPLKPRQAHYIVSNALQQAGIVKRKQGPHLLRHSGASLKAQQGENLIMIQYLLGHENLNTTRRYLHFDWDDLKKMVERSPRLGK